MTVFWMIAAGLGIHMVRIGPVMRINNRWVRSNRIGGIRRTGYPHPLRPRTRCVIDVDGAAPITVCVDYFDAQLFLDRSVAETRDGP